MQMHSFQVKLDRFPDRVSDFLDRRACCDAARQIGDIDEESVRGQKVLLDSDLAAMLGQRR